MAVVSIIISQMGKQLPDGSLQNPFWMVAVDWTPDREERKARLARIGRRFDPATDRTVHPLRRRSPR